MKESIDRVTEIDFETFGIKPKGELLRRASKALSDLYTFGDLDLRSAWLYYGSMNSAAKVLHVPIDAYRMAIRGQRQITHKKIKGLLELPETTFHIITKGSYMIMEMSEAERGGLFPQRYPLPLRNDAYVKRIESWTKTQVEKWGANPDNGCGFPIETAKRLVEGYVRCQEVVFRSYGVHTEGWQARRLVRTFMNACLNRSLQPAIKFRNRIEDAAGFLELYAVALGIIREYEAYCSQRSEIDKHVGVQRRIIESKYEEFFLVLEKRDGSVCRAKGCGSVEKLRIDHEKPLSLGGFSVLENLQLLCTFCNGRKGDRPMDYLHRRMDKSRTPAIK